MGQLDSAVRQALGELGGRATINELSFQTCMPLRVIRDHMKLHSTINDECEFVDAYGWDWVERDGVRIREWYPTGREAL